jgi:photosystem II stability/assembly factor-like uncharacterized protein
MPFDEQDLRRALDARSERPTAEFRGRLSAALAGGRAHTTGVPALALVATLLLAAALIGVLILSRHALQPRYTPGAATSPGVTTPTPSPSPSPSGVAGVLNAPPGPIAMPGDVQLSAPNANVVWALVVDQYLYRSTDGGHTWQQRPLPPTLGGRPYVSFVDDHEGWLVVAGSPETQCNTESVSVWHTSDGGATWDQRGANGVASAQCKGIISFVDPQHGFLDAWDDNHAPVIYRTADGGLTWAASKPLPDPPGWTTQPGGFTLQAGSVRQLGSRLLVTASGFQSGALVQYVFQSSDGGATWSYLGSAPNLGGSLAVVTDSRWIEVIGPAQTQETTDSGATWHAYASNYSQAAPIAPQVVFGSANVGYATVRGGIQTTVDGGLHWTELHTPGT